MAAVDFLHLPATAYSASYQLPGLPCYYLAATLGALSALFRRSPARRFQWAFVPFLFGTTAAVMLTAAVIPRHRFVLEPFLLLYTFYALDGIVAFVGRRAAPTP